MIDVEKQQATLIEKLSVKVAEASSTNQLADLIRDATCDVYLLSYSEILTFPNIIMLAGTEHDSSLDVLRLFAFGTWHDYQRDVESYPTLTSKQVQKLKQLHLITLMRSSKELKYDLLIRELQLADVKELKRFLEFCRNSGNIRFKLNDNRNKLVVTFNALELLTKIRGRVTSGQSFDVFLQEAAAVRTDPSGLVSNGIVKEFRVPLDHQNNFISRAEFQTRSGRLFGMLIQHATSAHSRSKSFGGKIYAGMFLVVGNELFLRSEAAPTKPLTSDNSILDYGAVGSIFVDNTALRIRDGTEEKILYPLYFDDLLKHLQCSSAVLSLKHRIYPMLKALDENYTTFLRCHSTFNSTSARTAVSVHVRRHQKYSSKSGKDNFRTALRDVVVEFGVLKYTGHRLFRDLLVKTYEPGPVGCFLLVRDWEGHIREHLTEAEKLIFTAPVRNFLIELFFKNFFPKALYGILCFYDDPTGSLDLRGWLQSLLRVSKTELVPTTTAWNRCSFGILHPPNTTTLEHLTDRFLLDMTKLEEKARDGSPDHYTLLKWRALSNLRDQNMAVYYKVLIDKIEEYAHIIHMPTVRIVSQSPSCIFQRPGVMHLSKEDTGNMVSMMHSCSADEVDMIVVTDSSGLTTTDDMGWESGTAVSGKVDLYVAASGMNPQKVIPVVIDVGTDNRRLLDDPLYRGLQVQRPKEGDYFPVIDEFMGAVSARWGNVVVQFEYVPSSLGFELLKRYKNRQPVFNDNIQGDTAVTIAGLLGAVRAKGRPMADFAKQKIVVAAADSGGPNLEVVNAITTMQMIAGNNKTTFETARKQIWMVDMEGLVTENRSGIDPDMHLVARKRSECICEGLCEGTSFSDVVQTVKPEIILLLSAVRGLCSQQVIQAIKDSSSKRPAIFAMSNFQCSAQEIFTTLGEDVVFASSDKFSNVNFGNGKIGYSNFVNKLYLYPGIALGTRLSGAHMISDEMLYAAAKCLASMVEDEDVVKGVLYPPISSIRDISKKVAAAVVREAAKMGLSRGYGDIDAAGLANLSEEQTLTYVENHMWSP